MQLMNQGEHPNHQLHETADQQRENRGVDHDDNNGYSYSNFAKVEIVIPDYTSSMDLQRVNMVVAASNLLGVPAILNFVQRGRYANAAMTALIILSSVLMHLSERKHTLPGIAPYNRYTQWFLNADRVMTVVGLVWFGYQYWTFATKWLWVEALTGMAFLRYSEWLPGPDYAAPHIIWHFVVYDLLLTVSKF